MFVFTKEAKCTLLHKRCNTDGWFMLVYNVTAREGKWQSGTTPDLLTNLFLFPKPGVLECITGTCCSWQMHSDTQDTKLNLGIVSVPSNKRGQGWLYQNAWGSRPCPIPWHPCPGRDWGTAGWPRSEQCQRNMPTRGQHGQPQDVAEQQC